MSCEYCLQIGGYHDPRCPNFIPPRALHYCSICREGIYGGERYVENDFGEYIHEDCIKNTTQLLKWLGYTVEIMEDTNEKQTN